MTVTIGPESRMSEVLEAFPGAQRALFRGYHIGGCSSCGFRPDETLRQVCGRNNGLNADEVLEHIRNSHEEDARILITPKELAALRQREASLRLLDVRSREEYEAVRIEGSMLMSQATVQEIMGQWPRDRMFVIVDHQGRQGLDAAAYFLGHGFENVRCLQGGLDAWSREVDPGIRRYQLG
jgi:rhodanese-related sulfurtransferase